MESMFYHCTGMIQVIIYYFQAHIVTHRCNSYNKVVDLY